MGKFTPARQLEQLQIMQFTFVKVLQKVDKNTFELLTSHFVYETNKLEINQWPNLQSDSRNVIYV